jgi:hypothetical protein
MRVLRFLALPLMFSACALAQSAPARVLVMQSAPVQIQPAPHWDFQLSPILPQANLFGRSLPAIGMAQSSLPQVLVLPQSTQESKVCYAMRSYAFARESVGSDATRWTGSSTCSPASQLKLKSAVQLKVLR